MGAAVEDKTDAADTQKEDTSSSNEKLVVYTNSGTEGRDAYLIEKAKEAGCQECVFYRPGGRVTECAHSNVHIIKDGKLITAPTDNLILPGIARAHIIKACKKLEIPVSETPYTLDDLFNADEVIVSSSSNLCLHANEIDGKPVGGKAPELLEKIRVAVLDEFYKATDK